MPIYLPEQCLRHRKDCDPLAQIESDDHGSFICCGHNTGSTRTETDDRFRLCWHNATTDSLHDYDDRDMKDTLSVLAQALSVDANLGAFARAEGGSYVSDNT